MPARLIFAIAAILFFILAAISVWSSLEWDPVGLIAVGLACFVGSISVPERV